MDRRLSPRQLLPLLCLALLGACTAGTDLCAQAEDLIYECRQEEVSFGTCSSEAAAEADKILAGGCEGLEPGKTDVFSQACQGFLRKVLPWCKPEQYSCESQASDLDSGQCNGSPQLCARPYDQVVYATSHNAFNAATMGFTRPNQSKRMYVQLRDGMRALMLDIYKDDQGMALCHGGCDSLGRQDLFEGLQDISDFLQCYPQEVVTLIIEPHTDGKNISDALTQAGLAQLAYSHTANTPWPTLGQMLESGKRIVVFSEKPGVNTPSWYMHQWDYAFENEYSVGFTDDFACNKNRGELGNDLFGLNHFKTVGGGDEFLSIGPNRKSSLMGHVDDCEQAFGRLPNFLAIDFHDIGSIQEVVRELNARP